MKKFIFIFTVVFHLNFAFADDVYNFQFQKTHEVTPPTPTVAAKAPTPFPSTPEKLDYWRYSLGYGFNKDLVGRVEGIVLGISYNFNNYFGLNGSYLIKQKFIPENSGYANQDHLNKIDLGFNFTPFSIRSFGLDLVEFTFYGGLTSIHNPPIYADDGTSSTAPEDYQGYIGLGFHVNITKDFSIEATTKTLANQIFFRNQYLASEHFTYISYNLIWSI